MVLLFHGRKARFKEVENLDFPGGPVAKHLPSNAGNAGSIPGLGTKIPPALEQLSPGHNKDSVQSKEVKNLSILRVRKRPGAELMLLKTAV